jgi:hypothetical protein
MLVVLLTNQKDYILRNNEMAKIVASRNSPPPYIRKNLKPSTSVKPQ